MKVFLDTHAAVALYDGRTDVFGPRSADVLERGALFCSPIVRLELAFLNEIGRLRLGPGAIMGSLETDLGVREARDDVAAVVSTAMKLEWTRDPFDRLIVATAALHRAPLVTRDRLIQDHYPDAVW